MLSLQALRAELRPTVRLALPLVLAELGWMSMAIVDTMLVGRLPNSATAMGAVSLGSNIFIVLPFAWRRTVRRLSATRSQVEISGA